MRDDHEQPPLSNEPNDPIVPLLAAFSPAPADIDRDRLMFLAGMRAASPQNNEPIQPRPLRLWPALALVSTAAAILLAVALWQRPERIVVVEREPTNAEPRLVAEPAREKVAVPGVTTPSHPIVIDPTHNYVVQRERLRRDRPDALDQTPVSSAGGAWKPVPTQKELLEDLPGEFRERALQVDGDAWWQPWLISGDRS